MKKTIAIVDSINVAEIYEQLSDANSGGICVFVGTVREFTQNEKVMSLEFETYEKMALKEMDKIAEKALEKWNLNKVVIRHAVGNGAHLEKRSF